jgi:hypothetical protein
VAKVIKLRQPEGGAEHGMVYVWHHRCPQANALARELGSHIDELLFPVGNVGYTMPLYTPFPVVAVEPCEACGRDVGAWFEWVRGDGAHISGELWTPSDN